MEKWIIEENTAAISLAAVLNKYGERLITQTNGKLIYNIKTRVDINLLVFSFDIKYRHKVNHTTLSFDITGDKEIKLCDIYYDTVKKIISAHSMGNHYNNECYSNENLISMLDRILFQDETKAVISNILFLSTENGFNAI